MASKGHTMHFSFQSYWEGFMHLFYPQVCLQCASEALSNEQIICNQCEILLPYTHFSKLSNSPIDKLFWGRVSIQKVNSILFFTKESIVQRIIFELKYNQNKKAGYLLGKLIAQDILKIPFTSPIDYLIPIPISAFRMRKRGFNQTKLICEAMLANGILIPLFEGLVKTKNTATQTKKDRLQRGIHTNKMFTLQNDQCLLNKNILIIDDVLTTGATIEAAVQCIQKAKPSAIFVYTAAYTLD